MPGKGTKTQQLDVGLTVEQRGNYFIIDSEQVVCNPLLQLQNEAIDSVKKVSFTEKLTSVKNNVCEHKFRSTASHLEREKTHKLRKLHINSNNLRYEVKLMDIHKRRNGLEMQKRMDPQKDFSYDAKQITNTEKRLGVINEESCYLDRRLKYPLRGTILRDHNAKPFIKKARQTMAEHNQQKKLEQEDRSTTALTMSTAICAPSSASSQRRVLQRRGSKSAPPNSKRFGDSSPSQSQQVPEEEEEEEDEVYLDGKLPSISNGTLPSRRTASHVKFLVQKPLPYRQSTPDGLYRAKTYHSGMTRRAYSEALDSDSDDDYSHCERVDLRALFFGNKSQAQSQQLDNSRVTTPRTIASTYQSSDVPLILRGQQAKPLTEERIKQENKQLRDKIDKFLGNIEAKEVVQAEVEPEEVPVQPAQTERSKASVLLNIFSKPLDTNKQWGKKSPAQEEKPVEVDRFSLASASTAVHGDDKHDKNAKKMWELIKTEMSQGNIRNKYSANDLILQQLTGILVHGNRKKSVVPIHAASRALRHTPTFKMKKVVEQLMQQRTRFEQQEVEKLQKFQAYGEGGMYGEGGAKEEAPPQYPPRAWATPTRQQEQET